MGSGDNRVAEKELFRDDFTRRYVRHNKAGESTAADCGLIPVRSRRGLWADPNPVPPWEY